ncbi:hypothetical protein PIB30_069237 [Stylosanthes scabra]|uniref:Uncharacterized protein n=1 Tax=Stylosanthes scabra TaxID=79078 RepID=A0ABU6VLK3_9FABA|nr:hypothetical protein [Stylosanthes scabra]
MDMLVTIVRVPMLVMPWIGCEFLGLRTHNNHICGRTFGSTVRLPLVSEPQPQRTKRSVEFKPQTSEQYITIEIPQDLIREYLAQNYTHLHLGAVRLILTLHGRKGLPITEKIALLDTTFKEYQNGHIGALVTTLTNGSVIHTISPDFTMRLTDPTLSQRIKIQVQLIGAIQDSAAEQATLHHQVLYRVQDHALDLKLPNSTGDALLMFHDKNNGPAIILDVHTTTPPRITRASDGTVTTVFQRPGSEGQSSFRQSSFRRICTISPIFIQHTAHPDDPPVHYYDNGKPIYVSHIQGHFIWDVDPSMCDSDCDCQDWNDWSDSEDEDYARRRRKSKKKKKQSCTVSRRPDPPDEPDYKPKFSLKRRSQKSYQDYSTANPQMVPYIATLGSYDHDFPPLQTSADDARVTRRPYVTPPQGVTPHEYQAITPQEEVLNWHTDNALNQNKVLNRIDHRLGTLEEKVDEASTHMSHLQAHIKELRDRLAT